ncbi:hypothetical protein P170DRAFT_270994 [Aspergillus steynii IBT 23096]|uniref:Uncharacterized protein n=1 Tax=Aspergillus steynii IBT 23096 TaxID=1392250 RepID=A0A2I2FWG7_9EURO|nr:uncharacterized protein P170DRAFT_270994 [Aspergillus steynii IBT 23096]PLB44982.1 hypothetical protein P170DRAFT_270994 [Aspergillus steynii IBT 23096]
MESIFASTWISATNIPFILRPIPTRREECGLYWTVPSLWSMSQGPLFGAPRLPWNPLFSDGSSTQNRRENMLKLRPVPHYVIKFKLFWGSLSLSRDIRDQLTHFSTLTLSSRAFFS